MAKIINIDLDSSINELHLYVLSDVHIGSPEYDEFKFKKILKQIKDDENSIVILNGDLLDNGIANSKSDVYSQQMTPSKQLEYCSELLYEIKDKIICSCQGNHEARTSKTVGLDLSEALTVQIVGREKAKEIYTSGCYLIFLSFGKNNGRDCRKTTYAIYGSHGTGGGGTLGSKVNRLVKQGDMIPNCDLVLMSHTHAPIVTKDLVSNVDYKNHKINIKTRTLVNTNAFLDIGGYGEPMALKPQSISVPVIILDGNKRDIKVVF